MLRLISPALLAPAALVLAPGSVVTVRRLTMVEWEAAEAEAGALTEAVRDGADVLSGLGVDLPAEADGSIAGLPRYLLAIEVGIRAITGWDGIGDAEGNPVEVSRDAVALLVAVPRHGRRILGAAFGHVAR
ncbi:hypothetical protein [Methylobrevis pamukkalensis]|uniref:Uncharacterized protein n=1 Tax=Methylobrevis pamukkalensis TaxID=1439726 RepID=A0A1E3H1L3_9HYPH|nr:hypothetical protein [Methylobrevis pamukkalensis]ODN70219.1 hypothetical protein A6302_02493 [Methylobrevis pamukkalensis]